MRLSTKKNYKKDKSKPSPLRKTIEEKQLSRHTTKSHGMVVTRAVACRKTSEMTFSTEKTLQKNVVSEKKNRFSITSVTVCQLSNTIQYVVLMRPHASARINRAVVVTIG